MRSGPPASCPRSNDVTRGDAVVIEELFGCTAARNLAHGEAMDGEAVTGHRRCHRIADAAGDVVVLDGDQTALGFARAAHERRGVDRLHAVEIDDADGDALLA